MNEKTMSKSVGIVLIAGLMCLVLGSSLLPTPPANAADVLLVSVAIIASPDTICVGQSTNISWSSFDATSVSINQGIGSVTNFGSRNVSPTQTTTYTITGTNPTGGYGVASATVYVTGPCSTPTPTPTWTPTPTPPIGNLNCTPSVQSASSGDWVSFSAWSPYQTFAAVTYTWNAVGGRPSTGTGSNFGTRFHTSSINETRVVTVTDGYQTASCTVFIYGPTPTWTPTPYPTTLDCSPSYTTANSGDRVYFNAIGGNGYSYSWSAPEGSPTYGNDPSFSTRFYNNTGVTQDYWVTVSSNTPYNNRQSDSCQVRVYPSYYPTPTPTHNRFSMDHSVRDLTHSDSGTSINARNGDRLQFTTTITTGSQYAEDVHVRDWLPSYVNYVYGSTTVDGTYYQDGIATGNNNDSLALGTLSPNRTYTVRFEATVSGAPKMTLTNSVNVHVRDLSDQSRTSTIRITGSSVTPNPTPYPTTYPVPGGTSQLAMTIFGRNVTLGQSGEFVSVRARGNDTVTFVIRVRAQDGQNLSNVYVTDYLPAGVNYIPSSTILNGYVVADGITSSGLNIGSLSSGQVATVTFSALVDANSIPTLGQVTVTDTAQARADGTNTASATLKMTLGYRFMSLAAASGVQTGPVDSVLLALAVAALMTSIYAAYTRTSVFGRRMATNEVARISGSTPNFVR